MKHRDYPATLMAMAAAAARREFQQRGVQMVVLGGRQYIVRTLNGEGLPLLRSSRSWRAL